MKRYFRILAAMTALSITFAACSDDDEDTIKDVDNTEETTPDEEEEEDAVDENGNYKPTADFYYTPTTNIIYKKTQISFVDSSTDEDGTIKSRQWDFAGESSSTEANPTYTFQSYGDKVVTLTVTDDDGATSSTSQTISVARADEATLSLLWQQTYETSDSEAYVYFNSPAVSADGSTVYAFSSGYKLYAYSSEGEYQWMINVNTVNGSADPYGGSSTGKKTTTCTPAVDADGNIILATGYNLDTDDTSDDSAVWSISPSGSKNWALELGYKARFICPIPVIVGDYVMIPTMNKPNDVSPAGSALTECGHAIDRTTGTYKQNIKAWGGTYGGGGAAYYDGTDYRYMVHNAEKYGTMQYHLESNTWVRYGADNPRKSYKTMGRTASDPVEDSSSSLESPSSSQMAISNDGLIYILYFNNLKHSTTSGAYMYCYDLDSFVKDESTRFNPKWSAAIPGKTQIYEGDGVVCAPDGTAYVTTSDNPDDSSHQGGVTAISSQGEILWTKTATGDISGVAAVDNQGYVYYCDSEQGTLVKLNPSTGSVVTSLNLGCSDLTTSPVISTDGTIYVNGIYDGSPTLFAIESSCTSHAKSWSQTGGGPRHTGLLGDY